MQIEVITKQKYENGNFSIVASFKKTKAEVFFCKKHNYINVICLNSSHAEHRGLGRTFRDGNWDGAIESYKKSGMKAIIKYAKSEVVGAD